MIGITYGIEPYQREQHGLDESRRSSPSWPLVSLLLVAFVVIETQAANPMFRLALFRIRAFTSGTLSSFLAAVARGGLMFMLIIWLQGIWLPQHGYSFENTPLWAGIYMLPLTLGILLAGPLSGLLSDRFGARPFATGGMIGAAISFVLLSLLPVNFSYPVFAVLLFMEGPRMGAFAVPNRAAVMNSLPPGDRGAGGGMNATFQNSAQVLSIGIFFTLMIAGLASSLPTTMASGLVAHGVPGPGSARRPPAAGLHPLRRVPGLQPHQDVAAGQGPGVRLTGEPGRAHRAQLLPAAHLQPVPDRAARGLRVRRRVLRGGGICVLVPGRALRVRRRHRGTGTRRR